MGVSQPGPRDGAPLHPHSIGLMSVTWSQPTARAAGKCGPGRRDVMFSDELTRLCFRETEGLKLILSLEMIKYMKDREKTVAGKRVGGGEALNIRLAVRGMERENASLWANDSL